MTSSVATTVIGFNKPAARWEICNRNSTARAKYLSEHASFFLRTRVMRAMDDHMFVPILHSCIRQVRSFLINVR